MNDFELVKTTCRRCGKDLMTGNKPLIGTEEVKAKWDRICKGCMTPADQAEMVADVRTALREAIESQRQARGDD